MVLGCDSWHGQALVERRTIAVVDHERIVIDTVKHVHHLVRCDIQQSAS